MNQIENEHENKVDLDFSFPSQSCVSQIEDIGNSSELTNGKTFIVSDTHFNHRNILKYEPVYRPFKDKVEMDNELITRWNSVVGNEDLVFHLGDFAFAEPSKICNYVRQLNGHIHLILGNHDRGNKFNWIEFGFVKCYSTPILVDEKFILSHEPLAEIPNGKINIYGHVHGHPMYNTIDNDRFCACVERHNCTPIDFSSIKKLYN